MQIRKAFKQYQYKQLKEYIEEHGIDFSLRKGPLDWSHIEDKELHKLIEYYRQHANLIDSYIELKLK